MTGALVAARRFFYYLGHKIVLPSHHPSRENQSWATWFKQGIVDWVMPMFYPYFVLDCDMPIEWLTQTAAEAGVAVYARLQPWERDETTGALQRIHANPATLRGAACNFLDKGCDGIYAHSLSWPLGAT